MIAPTGDLLVLRQSEDADKTLNFLHGYIVGEGSPLPQKDQILHSREARRLPYKGFFAFAALPLIPSNPQGALTKAIPPIKRIPQAFVP